MAELSIAASKPLSAQPGPALACRIRQKLGQDSQAARSTAAGEVELENTSSAALEIVVQMSPLQYLDLRVTDHNGDDVSRWHYGDCFSPLAEPYTFRLEPGERYTHNISLLGNVPKENQLPGRYTVQAIYEYQTIRAVSEPVQIQLSEAKGGTS